RHYSRWRPPSRPSTHEQATPNFFWMRASHRARTRLRQMFLTHLGQVKWRLGLGGLCTLGVAATDLLKPWPLKVILDHVILDKPLPRFLSFLQGVLPASKIAL